MTERTSRREALQRMAGLGLSVLAPMAGFARAADDKAPVLIGLDAEFGHKSSTSAQAVMQGMQIAVDEINHAGGVLAGRKLELIICDNQSIPAIGVDNLRALADKTDLVGVFGAKFSPVVLEWLPVAHELGLPIFATWSSADGITDHHYRPSYSFRLSLKDTWAASVLLRFALEERQARRVGLLLPKTSWGRSNQAALHREATRMGMTLVGERSYNWGERSLLEQYQDLRSLGAEAIILIANEPEGAILVKEVATLSLIHI